MLIHDGQTRELKSDLTLGGILAFIAGGVNSAGYLAYGYFSANMTGNVSMVSELLSVRHFQAAGAFCAIVGMFILGAFVATSLIQAGKSRGYSNIYALTLIVEAVVLALAGLWVSLSFDHINGLALVSVLSFSMGVQNAASTRISESRVRSTHVSGIATDIGVGLALLTGEVSRSQRTMVLERLRLHAVTIASFALGGIAGALTFETVQGLAFCLFSGALVLLSIRYIRIGKRSVDS